jgi:hypothetical protein
MESYGGVYMFDVEKYIIETTENRTEICIKRQYADANLPTYGAIANDELSNPDPKSTANQLLSMAGAWLYPKSRYYKDSGMFGRIDTALNYIKTKQHETGLFDLENVNFNSAPDTGFILWALIPLYRLLQKHEHSGPVSLSPLVEKIRNILLPAFDGICAGGFHTANHRWVNASTLAAGYNFTGNKAYLDKAMRYLAEGIDCNEYGDYSEKSAIYNTVNNSAMIMLFEELHDGKYLEYVKRNVEMSMYYLDHDCSLFTEKSVRQDRGKKFFPDGLYFQYIYIAHHFKYKAAAQVGAYIINRLYKDRYFTAPELLYRFMLHPELDFSDTGLFLSADDYTIPDYNRHFSSLGIVRYKSGDFAYSLMENNSKVLFFSAGDLTGYMTLTLGYFRENYVIAKCIQPTGNGYSFDFSADSYYYEPLDEIKEPIVDFKAFDNSIRKTQCPSSVAIHLEICHINNGIDLHVVTKGLDGVHYRFEFVLPPGKLITHESFAMIPEPGSSILLRNGNVSLHDKQHILTIGECFADRQVFFVNGRCDPRSRDNYTVYMTGTTNFDRVIKITSR